MTETLKQLESIDFSTSAGLRLGGASDDVFNEDGERVDDLKNVISFVNLGDNYYQVLFGSLVLGEVYRDENAWSYARWMIAGDRSYPERGGVNNSATKKAGYVTRASAARSLAVIRSGDIVSYVNTQQTSEQKG